MKITRRQFLKGAAAAGVVFAVPWKFRVPSAQALAYSPNLTKWIQSMRTLDILSRPGVDNALPIPTFGLTPPNDAVYPNTKFFEVEAAEFQDQLHPELPNPTWLWGYSPKGGPKRHIGGVIIASRGTASRIRFTNTLPNSHIIPIDTTIPGAGATEAHNRIAIHLHGGYIPWISDGGPFDWWDPNGTHGLSFLNGPGSLFDNIPGMAMLPGQADYFYPNDQSMRLMWYHDHAFGITRINAYAGLATGYLLLDAIDANYRATRKIPDLPSTFPLVFQDKVFVNPSTAQTDSTWATLPGLSAKAKQDGALWYEHVYDPTQFRLLVGPQYLLPPNPSAIPEFFGDTMLANGLVYPTVTVEAKRYRFFVLNACNARFLNINLLQVAQGGDVVTDPATGYAQAGTPFGPPIIQIGNEGGFLLTETTYNNQNPFNPATLKGNLLIAPAERADIIIDFTGKEGMEFMMYNDAPGPFPAGPPTTDFYYGNPLNPAAPQPPTGDPTKGPDTRNILRFKVVAGASDPQPVGTILDPVSNPTYQLEPLLAIPSATGQLIPAPGVTVNFVRDLTLNEGFDQYGRLKQMLGTTKPGLVTKGFGLDYLASPTEVVNLGNTEVWRIFNLTADTHPIHFHLVNVQVVARQPFRVVRGRFTPSGTARGPEPSELGWKETVQMHPGEVTIVIMKFTLPTVPFTVPTSPRVSNTSEWGMKYPTQAGKKYHEYVWHCHILEHEEHDMMRPLVVVE
jgi:spore coat protein A, manganese oxidase